MKKNKTISIKAEILFNGKEKLSGKTVVIENGIISDITAGKKSADYEGIVTPALVDPHSHIGMFREGEPGGEQEGNESLNQILPLSDPLNGIYFDDRAFREAVDFGVLYSCVMPGSGNLFGGRSRIIKNWAKHRKEAEFRDFGFKMALGYNPRSTTSWHGERPNTRMGIYGLLEKRFDDVLLKKKKAILAKEKKISELDKKKAKPMAKEYINQEYENEFAREDLALLDMLEGRKPVKVHVHKEDDVIYLLDLVKRYKIDVTAEHTGDVFHREIFEMLAEAGIPIVYGPLGSLSYKTELLHAYYQNAKLLMESGAEFGLMSDHPVIHVTCFRDSLKFFMINGMSETDAINLITQKNAKIIRVDDKIGSLQKGKAASLLVWDKNPLHLGAFPRVVIGEGNILREP
jgi:imidazolonepropionase-like amidohydrolase